MVRRWLWLASVLVLWAGLLLQPLSVDAQRRSGGSFGGSHFGGGGAHFGGGGAHFGGGYGGSPGTLSYGSHGRGMSTHGGRPLSIVVALLLTAFVVFAMSGRPHREGPPHPMSPRWNGVDMVRLRVALDWRARPRLQELLRTLSRDGHGTKKELLASLRAVVSALEEERLSWLYAHVDDFRPTSPPIAEARFRTLATEARATYEDELVRGQDGKVTERAGAYVAREHEGEGVVLITLVVASHEEIVDVGRSDADAVDRVLEALGQLRRSGLVALEIAWTPADENDRMSTATLEARHPGLTRLTSIGGRRFCDHCRAPYADELARCPHCGAPTPKK